MVPRPAAAYRRWPRWLLVGAAVVVALVLTRSWPRDQTVHYVLGDAAARVTDMDVRWAEEAAQAAKGDWTRQVTYHYAKGGAPRIVTHDLRLPDGGYTVEIEILSVEGDSPSDAARRVIRRRLTLSGGATSIELAGALSR